MTRKDESNAESSYEIANVWRLRGRRDLAMKAYMQTLCSCPGHLGACLELTELWLQKGETKKAIEICRATLRHIPDNESLKRRIEELEEPSRSEWQFGWSCPTGAPYSSCTPSAVSSDKRETLHIIFYTDCAGTYGAEQYNHRLMCEMVRWGYRLTCVQPEASHHLIEERYRVGIPHLWIKRDRLYERRELDRTLTGEAEARDLFDRLHPDLVFFGDGGPLSNLTAKKQAARRGLPYLILNHCVKPEWAQEFSETLRELPEIYQHAEAVVAVSRRNLDLLSRLFGLPSQRGSVIYAGVPSHFFLESDASLPSPLRKQLGLSAEAVVCATAARMEIMKGYQYLLGTLKILRGTDIWEQLHFVWAGTGTLEQRLRQMVKKLHLATHVHFLGQLPDVHDLLNASDIYILPSQYEGLPLSVLEAMAKGLPVLATAVSGTPEALGETGRLLPDPKDGPELLIHEMASAIEDFAGNPELRRSVGERCRKRAQSVFTEENMLSKYRSLLDQVIEGMSSKRWSHRNG